MKRRILTVAALVLFTLGLSAAAAGTATAAPTDEICPWVKALGQRYEVCIPLP